MLEGPELQFSVLGESVAGRYLLVRAVHDGHEAIRGRLRTDAHPREIFLQQVANERRLPRGVLPYQENHGLRFKVAVRHVGRVKFAELVRLFQGKKLPLVNLLEAIDDILIDLNLPMLLVSSEPGEHDDGRVRCDRRRAWPIKTESRLDTDGQYFSAFRFGCVSRENN